MSQLPRRIQTMLDRGHLHRQEFTTEEIAQIWKKAVASAKDAELPGLSVEGALRAAYEAGHSAVLALLAAHGLRTGSGRGHHEAAFAAASALETEGLEDLVVDSSEIRGLRQHSLYDPTLTTEEERQFAIDWMRRTLPVVRQILVKVEPTLASRTENFLPPGWTRDPGPKVVKSGYLQEAVDGVPRISEFYSLETLRGILPHRARSLVLEWAVLHREELRENFERAEMGETLLSIEPLP